MPLPAQASITIPTNTTHTHIQGWCLQHRALTRAAGFRPVPIKVKLIILISFVSFQPPDSLLRLLW